MLSAAGSMFSGCSFTKGKAILPGKELLTPPPTTTAGFPEALHCSSQDHTGSRLHPLGTNT